LPAEIDVLAAGVVVEDSRFDPMDQLARLAGCRDEVEPAPGRVDIGRNGKHPASEHIEAAEVVEQPAVEALVTKAGRHRSEFEHAVNPPEWRLWARLRGILSEKRQ